MRNAFDAIAGGNVKTFLEIGSLAGASLYVYAGACEPGALLVAVDAPRTPFNRARLGQTCEALRAEGYVVEFVDTPSHYPTTALRVGKLAPRVDALHIDGSHKPCIVAADYRLYSQLVRPGGLIFLHDVGAVNCPGPTGVFLAAKGRKTLWDFGNEYRAGGDCGIGMIEVGEGV